MTIRSDWRHKIAAAMKAAALAFHILTQLNGIAKLTVLFGVGGSIQTRSKQTGSMGLKKKATMALRPQTYPKTQQKETPREQNRSLD